MFRAHVLIVRRAKLYYTVSGIITPIGGRPVQYEHHSKPAAPNLQHTKRTENKTTDVVIQQHSRKLLKMDILMFETC